MGGGICRLYSQAFANRRREFRRQCIAAVSTNEFLELTL